MFRGSETFFKPASGSSFANPPASNNATDIGSSSFAFRSIYLATSVRFNSTAFSIFATTSDGSDNASLSMSGGGSVASSRGAYLSLYGNENANVGRIDLVTGDVSGTYISFNANSESFRINYSTNAEISFHKTNAYIRASTSDGSDSARIIITGGGNVDVSRGATLFLYGNENSTSNGSARLLGGAVAAGHVDIETNHSSALIRITTNASLRWSFDGSGNILQDGTNGGDLVFGKTSGIIRQNTSDGTDNKLLILAGGGSNAVGRGSFIELSGNEHANGGAVNIWGGAISTGHINSVIGHSSAKIQFFNASTAVMWDINNSGNITQNSSNGGNIVFQKNSTGMVFTADNAVSAAGSSASDATLLTKNVNFVSTVAASTGVKLWDGGAGFGPIVVRNGGANTLTVYAPTGHTINGSGNSQTCSTTQTIIYFQVSSTNWVALKA